MNSPAFRGPLAGAFAALAFASALEAQPATGPWAKVPALPTGCYSSQDQFYEKVEAVKAAVQEEHYRQNDINSEIDQQVGGSSEEDAMEMVRRLQEKMMADPQNAMKYVQEMQTLGQQVNTEQPVASDRELQMQAEEKALTRRYEAALAQAYVPGNARWTALKKKMGIPMDSRGPGESGVPDWAWEEWFVILREWDAADRATCAQFFVANGQMHAHMKRYKDYLLAEQIPHHKKYIDEPKLRNFEMLSVPAEGYKSTAEYEAVEDYLDLAYRLFSQRQNATRCTADRCD